MVEGTAPGAGGEIAITNKIRQIKRENVQLRIMLA